MSVFNNVVKTGIFCVLFLLIFQLYAFAQDFEGTIYYEIPEMKKNNMGEMAYKVKDSKVRIEFGEGMQKGAMLFFPEESKMVFLIEQMKGYMTMDTEDMDYMNANSNDNDQPEMEKTGTTKTIAGKRCEVWKMTENGKTFEMCMAEGMGTFMMPTSPMSKKNNIPEWAKEAMAEGVMPLEVIEAEKGVQMKATRIQEESLEASLFEIPEGYNDMSGMMKQMMQRNKN